MGKERTIWLIRHGNREDFIDKEWRQKTSRPHDPPLSADGIEQARLTGLHLVGEKIDHIFCSPFLRTVQTAATITAALGMSIKLEPGLGELHLAEWFPVRPETLAAQQLREFYPAVDAGYEPVNAPGYPETWEEAEERAATTARRLLERYQGNLVLVGHGGPVFGSVMGILGGREFAIHTPFCSLIQISGKPGAWRIERDGSDTSHWAGARDR